MSRRPRRGWFDLRPPGGGVAFYAGCLIVFPLLLLAFTDDVVARTIASLMLALGVGLWLKHSWARWVAFAFFSMAVVLLGIRMAIGDFTPRNLIKLMVAMSTIYMLWEWDVWPADASETSYDEELYQEDSYLSDDHEYEVDVEEYDDQDYEEEDYEPDEEPWEEEDRQRFSFSPWKSR